MAKASRPVKPVEPTPTLPAHQPSNKSLNRKFAILQTLKAQGIERDPRKCIRFMKKSNRYCERWAIAGGTVCIKHGGNAPQVRKAARERLLESVDPTITRLEEIRDQNVHMPSALGASNTLLNRALGKPGDGPKMHQQKGPTINIGISLTGDPMKPIAVLNLPQPQLPAARDVDDDDIIDGYVDEDEEGDEGDDESYGDDDE